VGGLITKRKRGKMMNTKTTEYWLGHEVDQAIVRGDGIPVFTIRCEECGSFGFSDAWPYLVHSGKSEQFCPNCGGINVKEI